MALGDCSCNIKSEPSTPVAIMCDPNNLLGGGGGGTAGLDYEIAVLANPADLTQPVIVVNNFNPITGVYTPVLRNVDGTPYTGGTPVLPSSAGASFDSVAGCDVSNQTIVWDTTSESVSGNVLSFNVVDGVGTTEALSKVRVFVTSDTLELKQTLDDSAGPFNFAVDTTTLSDGDYKIYTEVTYPSGNVFIDLSHDITVASGTPVVTQTYLSPGAHVVGGTRAYDTKVDDALLIFDSTGALTGSFALPLTPVPTPYVLAGNDFQVTCPDVVKESLTFTSSSSTHVVCECWIDDTLSDGSVLVPFSRFKVLNLSDGSLASTFDKTPDLSSEYTVVGTAVECQEIGNPSQLVPRRQHITGATTFTLPTTAQSVTVKVRNVGNVVTPPTINDGTTVTPLFVGDVETWSALDGTHFLLEGTFVVTTTDVADLVTILWTEVA